MVNGRAIAEMFQAGAKQKSPELVAATQVLTTIATKLEKDIAGLGTSPTDNTRIALRVAMAAQNTFICSETLAPLAEADNRRERIDARAKITGVSVSEEDERFEGYDSQENPPVLRRALATWLGSQIVLNHQAGHINGQINNSADVGNLVPPASPENVAGFKYATLELYDEAATLRASEGHTEAAGALRSAVAAYVTAVGELINERKTPAMTLHSLAWELGYGDLQLAIALGGDHYADSGPSQAFYRELAAYAATGEAPQPPVKPVSPPTPAAS